MKQYITPKLEYFEWQQDVVTASLLVEGTNDRDGDFSTPSQNFWN